MNRGDENKPFERLLQYSNNTLPCRCRNPQTRVPQKDGPQQLQGMALDSQEELEKMKK